MSLLEKNSARNLHYCKARATNMIAKTTETLKQIIQETAKDKYTQWLVEKAKTENELKYNEKIL